MDTLLLLVTDQSYTFDEINQIVTFFTNTNTQVRYASPSTMTTNKSCVLNMKSENKLVVKLDK